MVITKKGHIQAQLYNDETAEECQQYAQYIGGLLQSQVEYHQPELTAEPGYPSPEFETAGNNLLIYNEPPQSRLRRWLFGSLARQAVRRASTSLLLARQPRWPIQNILLILRSDLGDETAVDWVQEIVQITQANVTVLPIVPAIPSVYRHGSYAHLGLDAWAAVENSRETDLGRLACWLISRNTTATLRLRLGEPQLQIRQEVSEGNYDLIVLAAEPYGRFSNWLFGELVGPLLNWIDRPVLVTRPPI